MAMIPAEKSRPARRWPSSGTGVEEPFWAVVIVVFFLGALFLLAKGALDIAPMIASEGDDSAGERFVPLAMFIVGVIVVIGLITTFGRHPRTRSAMASATFAAIKAVMFLAGIVLFLGGALRVIETTEFVEQVTLAMLSLFFLATPLYLHFNNA